MSFPVFIDLKCIVFALIVPIGGFAQTADTKETLEWVKRRADHLEALLNGAAMSHEPMHLNLQLWTAWQEFDAIAQMGLQCGPLQVAAEKGRTEADILGYNRGSNIDALILRAVEARRQALLMRQSADYCLQLPLYNVQDVDLFGPRRLLRHDAEIASLDLADALAIDDRAIRNQKVEHALFLLRRAEFLASTLEDCVDVRGFANRAIAACSLALLEEKEEGFQRFIEDAAGLVDKINRCERCR